MQLPIDEYLPRILSAFATHSNLIISAAPGAGKTTRVPPALAKSSLISDNAKIIMLQPRRVAARAAAARIASEQSWQLGKEVGYQVRFENRVTATTKIHIVTEGILTRKLQSDPELNGVGMVILDEFHERSLHTDLALGCLREMQMLSRPDLKIIVMSATLQTEPVRKILGDCELIEVPGQLYPMTIHYSKHAQLLRTGPEFIQRVVESVRSAVLTDPLKKDILVFLPGTGEIRRVHTELEAWAKSHEISVVPLHGSLNLEQQSCALASQSRRRVVLATNIAETSLTLDGIATVVDSGLVRVLNLNPNMNFPRLELARISGASATQRAGRSARQFPGRAIRLWSQHDEISMRPAEIPEIQRSDLCEALLLLAAHGIQDFKHFSWVGPPPDLALTKAHDLLVRLQALSSDNRLTPIGKKMLNWPLHPRLARLMVEAEACDVRDLGATVCALLQERDLFRSHRQNLTAADSDIVARLEALEEPSRFALEPVTVRNILQVRDQLLGTTRDRPLPLAYVNSSVLEKLLLSAFPDRICRRRRPGENTALMLGGRGVQLAPSSHVRIAEFFIAVEAQESDEASHVTVAAPISKETLLAQRSVQSKIQVIYDETRGEIVREQAKFFEDLPLEEPRVSPASAEERAQMLPGVLVRLWPQRKQNDQYLQQWLARIEFLARHLPERNFPQMTEAFIRRALEAAALGENSVESAMKKDLIPYFEMELTTEQRKLLATEAPAQLVVPSGHAHGIWYEENQPPRVEVRIQEVFGLLQSPRLACGRVSLVMHLLAPNFRPAQVTSDLASFWQNAYQEVRKELRARYPKHSWPENPFTAKAEAKGRRSRST